MLRIDLEAVAVAAPAPWYVPPPRPGVEPRRLAELTGLLVEPPKSAGLGASFRAQRAARAVLSGAPGSGRRGLALAFAAAQRERFPGGGFLLPALASRVTVLQRELAEASGLRLPRELSPEDMTRAYRAMLVARPGLLILDARYGADEGVIDALVPGAGWTVIVLAPGGGEGLLPGAPCLALPAPTESPAQRFAALRGQSPELAQLVESASLFDPWAGALLHMPARAAGLDAGLPPVYSALGALQAAGALSAGPSPDRLVPSLHLVAARGAPGSSPAARAAALGYLTVYHQLAAHVRDRFAAGRGAEAELVLQVERPNILTALSLLAWRLAEDRAAALAMAADLDVWLPLLIDEPANHDAAAFLLELLDEAAADERARTTVTLYRSELFLAAGDPAGARAELAELGGLAGVEAVDVSLRRATLAERAGDAGAARAELELTWRRLRELIDAGAAGAAARLRPLVDALGGLWRRGGLSAETLESLLAAAAAAAQAAGASVAQGAALLAQAQLEWTRGRAAAARLAASSALDAFAAGDDATGVLAGSALLAESWLAERDLAQAEAALARGAASLHQATGAVERGNYLEAYADWLQQRGEPAAALPVFEAALACFRRAGATGQRGEARLLRFAAAAARRRGDFARAQAQLEVALGLLEQSGHPRERAGCALELARVHGALARTADAGRLAAQVRAWAAGVGEVALRAAAELTLGGLAVQDGRSAEAMALLAEARAGAAALGDRALEAEAARALADAHLLGGDRGAAAAELGRARDAAGGDAEALAAIEVIALRLAEAAAEWGSALASAEALLLGAEKLNSLHLAVLGHLGRARALSGLGRADDCARSLMSAEQAARAARIPALSLMVEAMRLEVGGGAAG